MDVCTSISRGITAEFMHGRMVISIFLACGALAGSMPGAALGADLPLPVSADAAAQQVAQVQRSTPAVSLPPAAEQVARDAAPAATRPVTEQVTQRVAQVASPARNAATPQPATAASAPVQARSDTGVTPPSRSDAARRATERTRASHSTRSRPAARSSTSTSPASSIDEPPPSTPSNSGVTKQRAPTPDDAPGPQLPGASAAATAGLALGGSLLAVLIGGLATRTARRFLTSFLRAPPTAVLCSAIEQPG